LCCGGGCRFAAVDVVFFPISLLYISLARRRLFFAGEKKKRGCRHSSEKTPACCHFYGFGAAGVRGQPAGRYAIRSADHTHALTQCFFHSAGGSIHSLWFLARGFIGKLLSRCRKLNLWNSWVETIHLTFFLGLTVVRFSIFQQNV
jgi:hypothetical protein